MQHACSGLNEQLGSGEVNPAAGLVPVDIMML